MLSADEARQRAALIISRIRAGEEPLPLPLAARANGGPTVADLAARYLEEHVKVRLKPRTRENVRGVLRNHILPALGKVPVAAVERRHVVDLQQSLSAYPVAANRTVKILSHTYRLSEGWGLAPEGRNPCRSVEKFPGRSRERFLTDAEFARLGQVLDEAVAGGSSLHSRTPSSRPVCLAGRELRLLSVPTNCPAIRPISDCVTPGFDSFADMGGTVERGLATIVLFDLAGAARRAPRVSSSHVAFSGFCGDHRSWPSPISELAENILTLSRPLDAAEIRASCERCCTAGTCVAAS